MKKRDLSEASVMRPVQKRSFCTGISALNLLSARSFHFSSRWRMFLPLRHQTFKSLAKKQRKSLPAATKQTWHTLPIPMASPPRPSNWSFAGNEDRTGMPHPTSGYGLAHSGDMRLESGRVERVLSGTTNRAEKSYLSGYLGHIPSARDVVGTHRPQGCRTVKH